MWPVWGKLGGRGEVRCVRRGRLRRHYCNPLFVRGAPHQPQNGERKKTPTSKPAQDSRSTRSQTARGQSCENLVPFVSLWLGPFQAKTAKTAATASTQPSAPTPAGQRALFDELLSGPESRTFRLRSGAVLLKTHCGATIVFPFFGDDGLQPHRFTNFSAPVLNHGRAADPTNP